MKHFLITATYYRSSTLWSVALPSVLAQTNQAFHWILINDGLDPATHGIADKLIHSVKPNFSFTYVEMPHPSSTEGFGLCHARNLGLLTAHQRSQPEQSKLVIVSYLDDDNTLEPDFIAWTQQFFHNYPSVNCSMVQQLRQRDVIQDRQTVRSGKPFISPCTNTDTIALIQQQELFDSNGFTHILKNAPSWNPAYRIFADYEYFLQCLCQWGNQSFKLNEQLLVNYKQNTEGVIGQSNYQDWVNELQAILKGNYPVISSEDRSALSSKVQQWQRKSLQNQQIPAFVTQKGT